MSECLDKKDGRERIAQQIRAAVVANKTEAVIAAVEQESLTRQALSATMEAQEQAAVQAVAAQTAAQQPAVNLGPGFERVDTPADAPWAQERANTAAQQAGNTQSEFPALDGVTVHTAAGETDYRGFVAQALRDLYDAAVTRNAPVQELARLRQALDSVDGRKSSATRKEEKNEGRRDSHPAEYDDRANAEKSKRGAESKDAQSERNSTRGLAGETERSRAEKRLKGLQKVKDLNPKTETIKPTENGGEMQAITDQAERQKVLDALPETKHADQIITRQGGELVLFRGNFNPGKMRANGSSIILISVLSGRLAYLRRPLVPRQML